MEKEGSKEKENSFFKAALGYVFLGRILWEQRSRICSITSRFEQIKPLGLFLEHPEVTSLLKKLRARLRDLCGGCLGRPSTQRSKTSLKIFGNIVLINTRCHIGYFYVTKEI